MLFINKQQLQKSPLNFMIVIFLYIIDTDVNIFKWSKK